METRPAAQVFDDTVAEMEAKIREPQKPTLRQQQAEFLRRVLPSGEVTFFTPFDSVIQFHAAALSRHLSHIGKINQGVPVEVVAGRRALIEEEVNKELFPLLDHIIAAGGVASLEHKAELLDHIADSIYVLMGLAVNFGLPLDAGFSAVHRANMAKLLMGNEPVFFEEGNPEGQPVGKVKKPEGWIPPNKAIWEVCYAMYKLEMESEKGRSNNLPDATAGQEPVDPGLVVEAKNPAIPPV